MEPLITILDHREQRSVGTRSEHVRSEHVRNTFFDDDAIFFRRRENFSKERSGRREQNRPKIVKIGAILAIFEPSEVGKFTCHF